MSHSEHSLSWADFERVEMRVGRVLSAEAFEKARKPSYKLQIDFGPYGIKKSSAQITQGYNCDELIGKLVVAVVNFPAKQIADMMSECLVLGAVGDAGLVTLISPDKEVSLGQRIA